MTYFESQPIIYVNAPTCDHAEAKQGHLALSGNGRRWVSDQPVTYCPCGYIGWPDGLTLTEAHIDPTHREDRQ